VKAWEVGLKSDLLQNRLRVNLAVFRNKYTDLQVDQRRSPVVFTDTLNAGSATVKGVELESVAVLGNHLSASLFYSWLDGEYGSYVDNGVDYAAARYMQNAPKNQYGLGLEYAFPHTAIGELSLGIDYRKQDESYANPMAYSLSPGYEVWNARLQLAEIPVPQGALRIAAWAKNLADEEYRVATTNLGSMAAQFGAPRSAGLDVIYEF
jgi:iron complex outermembrane receptor protein